MVSSSSYHTSLLRLFKLAVMQTQYKCLLIYMNDDIDEEFVRLFFFESQVQEEVASSNRPRR